jgi:hypothetical protein
VPTVVGPWTQTLAVQWRSELQFYEERIAMLRDLENAGVLKAFSVGEDYVAGRILEGGRHQMTVRKDGLSLDIIGDDADTKAVLEIAVKVMQRVAPSRTRLGTARFYHLVPLDMPFEDAIARSIEHLFPPITTPDISGTDYAMLMDLKAPDEVHGQVEFGVVRGAEARARLSGIGQRVGRASQAVREHDWASTRFPDVALFADSGWEQPASAEQEGPEWNGLLDFWAAATEYAGLFVEAVQGRITEDCYNRRTG